MKISKIDLNTNKTDTISTNSQQDAYINCIHPQNNGECNNTEEKKAFYQAITKGTYNGDKVKIGSVTHFKYADAKQENLINYSGIKVHKKCAENFQKMQADAKRAGVNLNIVSGYRSCEYQKSVFAKKFIDKSNPSEEEIKSRIRFSAPSGFSEHSTGLAIDINSTSQNFAKTNEYKWLQAHAKEYGFEISYPQNNVQGLGFEPWHWRYVGDTESKQTFETARKLASLE